MKQPKLTLITIGLALLLSNPSAAEVEIGWGAFVENDLRAAVARVDEPGIQMNRTTLGGDVKIDLLPDKFRFVGDLKFVWTGFTADMEFEGLTSRSKVSPIYLESDAAYMEILSLLPGLDVRIGRQIVQWGTADMFNPTNNLNALDLEDPLKFGETIANQMVKVDWMPGDNFIFSAVWVPVFQPAMLPTSSRLVLGNPSSEFPFASPETRLEAEKLRSIWLSNPDSYVVNQPDVAVKMPGYGLKNSQFALKVQWALGLFDMSLSYYQGIDPLPAPAKSASSTTSTDELAPSGAPKIGVDTDVSLIFPKKKVVGFDMAGQLPFLDDAGIWFEGAFVFPQQVPMHFDVTEVAAGSKIIIDDTVPSEPFFKCVVGLDYTINQYLFVTGQFIHGFPDEFGATNIHDYWTAGLDVKLAQDRILLRTFVLGEIPHEDDDLNLDTDGDGLVEADSNTFGATNDGTIASYAIYFQAVVKPMDGLELALGGYFPFGHQESKFAQDAAGPSLITFRAMASF